MADSRIKELERKLKDSCIRGDLKAIAGFTVMYDDENGHTIRYVRNMPKENEPKFRKDLNENIGWPYTGFVIGSMLGWDPISHKEIISLLEKYRYSIEDFTNIEKHFTYRYI